MVTSERIEDVSPSVGNDARSTLGPNTNLEPRYLSDKVVLCAGEDADELLGVAKHIWGEPREAHSYRCYRFWRFEDLTLIWTGIGTGCLEPLLYEILHLTELVHEIVLIGTAGAVPQRPELESESTGVLVDVILKAYLANTPFSEIGASAALEPDWPSLPPGGTSIVSTDFYYDDRWLEKGEQDLSAIARAYEHGARLLDMEVAQFYWLCKKLPKRRVHHVAIKGAANPVGHGDQQVMNSRRVLRRCCERASELLEIGEHEGPAPPAGISVDKLADKLTEEIQLYWTIQLGIVAALGALFTQLSPENVVASVVVSAVSFLLVMIGTVNNVTGNYYTFMSRQRLGLETRQEGVISSWMELVYFLLTGICGAAIGWSVNNVWPNGESVVTFFPADLINLPAELINALLGGIGGLLVNVLIVCRVFYRLIDVFVDEPDEKDALDAEDVRQREAYRQYVRQKWPFGKWIVGMYLRNRSRRPT